MMSDDTKEPKIEKKSGEAYELLDNSGTPAPPSPSPPAPRQRESTTARANLRGSAAGRDDQSSNRSAVSDLPPRPCPNCGYDLRGRLSEHCPECGRMVSDLEIESAIESKRIDWTDIWAFRYIAFGALPMAPWVIVALVVGRVWGPAPMLPLIVLGVGLAIVAAIWAAREVAEETAGESMVMMTIIVFVPTLYINLSILGFVADHV